MDVPDGSPFLEIVDRPDWQLASIERDVGRGDSELVVYAKFQDCEERWLGCYDCDSLVDLRQILGSTRKFSDTEFDEFLLKLRQAERRTREIRRDLASQPYYQRFVRWFKAVFRR